MNQRMLDTQLLPDNSYYPQQLLSLADRPAQLYWTGDRHLALTHGISIVGSRKATKTGESIAHNIAAYFAERGYTIFSGMAEGIDEAAHRGAMSVPGGKTVAILASGLATEELRDAALAKKIVEHDGLLLTEYAHGRGTADRYRRRDQWIAALGIVCIPVQAAQFSGTMKTVRLAIGYHHPIWYPDPAKLRECNHVNYDGIHQLRVDPRHTGMKGKEDYPRLEAYLEEECARLNGGYNSDEMAAQE